MARKSRYMGYVSAMTKEQADRPASSVIERLSQLKEQTKSANKKEKKED